MADAYNMTVEQVKGALRATDLKDMEGQLKIRKTIDLLVENGIKGIVNFTSEHFNVPKDVYVKSIDVVSSIQELVFETNTFQE